MLQLQRTFLSTFLPEARSVQHFGAGEALKCIPIIYSAGAPGIGQWRVASKQQDRKAAC